MRYFTGDEVGLVKAVTFVKPAPPERPRKRQRGEGDNDKQGEKQKTPSGPQPVVQVWGNVNREAQVQLMCWGGTKEDKQIVVARKWGHVQYLSAEDGSVRRELRCFEPACDANGQPKLNKHRKEEHFVGVHDASGTLITCTDLGIVRYQHAPDSQPSDLPDIEATLGQDLLFCMQVHPAQPHIFATGGDERDLCVWDITKAEKVEEGGLAKLQPIWKAKNVKNDFLDLRVPVWITNLRWLSDTDTTRIVVGTGYHQIRVYDTKKARRPVLSVEIGEHPVRSLCPSPDGSEAVFSDTTGKMTIVQLGTGKTAGTFSNLSGAVTAIHVGKDTVVTVGLDRFLRIYERKGRKALTTKAYLKQRLTTLLVDEDYVEEGSVEEKERTREDGDDELWAEMDAVTEEAGPAEERKAGKRSKIKSGKRKVAVPDDGME